MMILEFYHFLLIYLTGMHLKRKFPSSIRVDSYYSQILYLQICLLAKIYLYPLSPIIFLVLSQSFTDMSIRRVAKICNLLCMFPAKVEWGDALLLVLLLGALLVLFWVVLLFKHRAEVLCSVLSSKRLWLALWRMCVC